MAKERDIDALCRSLRQAWCERAAEHDGGEVLLRTLLGLLDLLSDADVATAVRREAMVCPLPPEYEWRADAPVFQRAVWAAVLIDHVLGRAMRGARRPAA
jgi:hypothetical protein